MAAEIAVSYNKASRKPFCQQEQLAANETVTLRRYLASLLARHELRDHWHSDYFIQTALKVAPQSTKTHI